MIKKDRLFYVLIIGILVYCMMPLMAYAQAFTAQTADKVNLKMLRYRPPCLPGIEEPVFNASGEPVLLFPGIVCNMNEFLVHTPDDRSGEYADMSLPSPLPDWAMDDPWIEDDPMRLYNFAHYLWLKGYDPWFANYRGTGRGEFKSDKGDNLSCLDVWATLDVPACVEKVYEITGKYPFIGGHSTGGLVSYVYLQGVTLDTGKLGNGYIPHVYSDPALAEARNAKIPGFIGIDPAGIPPMPDYVDHDVVWALMWMPVYLDLETLMGEYLNNLLPGKEPIIISVDMLMGFVFEMDGFYQLFGDSLPEIMNVFEYLNFWNTHNMHDYVEDYFARYAASSCYLRGMSQYFDSGMHKVMREHWTNGEGNGLLLKGPDPAPETDGYYYYIPQSPYDYASDQNTMKKVTVPATVVLSYTDSLVDADEVIRDFMYAKTFNALDDDPHLIPDTGHVDVVCGDSAPYTSFGFIGAWLDSVCAAIQAEDVAGNEGSGDGETPDTDASTNAAAMYLSDSNSGYCFITISGMKDQ
ncbi:MAG: hypothetical protein U9P80_03960 [Thermodesulfobacteriota bacterium]|nr:hypothetical protein [Thermodesulfobacteriota bacterium]